MRIVLGNRHAVESRDNGDTRVRMPKGKRATEIIVEDSEPLSSVFLTVTAPRGVWANQVLEKRGEDDDDLDRDVEIPSPAWVASDNDVVAQLLASHYGVEVRELDDNPSRSAGGSGRGRAMRLGPMLTLALTVAVLVGTLAQMLPWLKTNAGNDFQAAQMGGAASATAVAKFVGLTANTTAPAAGDTTLTGEITTAGGGLIRKAGAYAHTTGAASYTITTTFTANGSDSLPVTIGKRGIFDAVTAGNLVFETLVTPTATLSASGDALTLTDTISL